MMWRHIASNALTVMVVALVLIGGIIAWGKQQYVEPGPLTSAICLRVEPGSNFRRVSEDLARFGAISDPRIFRIGVQYSGKDRDLKAGAFLVKPGSSMAQIVDEVTQGGASTCGSTIVLRIGVARNEIQVRELDTDSEKVVTRVAFDPAAGTPPEDYTRLVAAPGTRYQVIFAEGTTVWQVVEGLKQADFLEGAVESLPPEGMLAPDAYEVSLGEARADLLAEMVAKQQDILDRAWANRAEGLPYETPQEALIMASIIEKETGQAEERALVASVFVNRLKRGMRLQTDPAVIYGVTQGRGGLGRGLRQSKLRAETPYNPYVITGLPPTPIANPGRDAIEAALHPAETEYIFFVADGTGGHAFAATLQEHNRNVAAWRALEAEREAAAAAAAAAQEQDGAGQ